MGSLATLDDLTPTTSAEVETRHRALDPRCRHKLAKLNDEREARHAVVEALGLKLRSAREELVTKRRRLADAIANATPEWSHGESAPGGGAGAVVFTGGFPGRAVREQEVARLAENLEHAETTYQAAQARWATVARLVENCREWLAVTPLDRVVVVPVPFERLADPRAEVEAIRAQIAALAQEAETIERAPVPASEALQRLDALARAIGARVAARRAEQARGFFAPSGVRGVDDLYALAHDFATAPREVTAAIRERCEEDFLRELKAWRAAVQAQAAPGEPVASAERPKRLAAIARQRHELEQREEAIVLSAERDGLDLDRRGDPDPAIVLCTVLADAAA